QAGELLAGCLELSQSVQIYVHGMAFPLWRTMEPIKKLKAPAITPGHLDWLWGLILRSVPRVGNLPKGFAGCAHRAAPGLGQGLPGGKGRSCGGSVPGGEHGGVACPAPGRRTAKYRGPAYGGPSGWCEPGHGPA